MALHELDPLERFSNRARDYAKYRPTYPQEAIDAIVEGLSGRAADIGAGTGISARLLGDRGFDVVAIEPNEAMRREAAPHERVTWREGTGEATGLDEASVDLVLVAQAFHWMRPEEATSEFRRILKPGGRAALMWNVRDVQDDFTRAYGEIVENVGGVAAVSRVTPRLLEAGDGFERLRSLDVRSGQRLSLEGLLGRAMSSSYVPNEGEARVEVVRRITDCFEAHAIDGEVDLRYVTRVFLGHRNGSGV